MSKNRLVTEQKTVSLGEVFTDPQLCKALRICGSDGTTTEIVNRLVREITEPALEHINKVTGQENDARYWAYLLIHTQARKQRRT